MKLDQKSIVKHIQQVRPGDVFPELVVSFNGVGWTATLSVKNSTWSESGDSPSMAMDKVLLLYGVENFLVGRQPSFFLRLKTAFAVLFDGL